MISEKLYYTPVSFKVLGVWPVCDHSGKTLQGRVPQSECSPAFISTTQSLGSGISYLRRVPSEASSVFAKCSRRERNIIRDFQVVTGTDLGPTGNLPLTQTHAIWV